MADVSKLDYEANLVQRIAIQIENRIETLIKQGDLPKTGKRVEDQNFALWMGTIIGLRAGGGAAAAQADWVERVVGFLIYSRGYSETKSIAALGRAANARGAAFDAAYPTGRPVTALEAGAA